MILALIRSHNRTGVKNQYCRHCLLSHERPSQDKTTDVARSTGAETHHNIWRWLCTLWWPVCVCVCMREYLETAMGGGRRQYVQKQVFDLDLFFIMVGQLCHCVFVCA